MYDLLDMTCIPVDIVMKLDGLFPIVGDSQVHIEDVKWEPGGSGNIFVFFNRLGGKVLPLAPIGNDIYGRWLKEVYEEEGIETKALIVTEGYHTQVANAIIDKNGVHTFASTLPSVAFGDDELFKELSAQSRSYYLTGYSVAGDKDLDLAQNSMKLLRGFREAGKPVFFDPGPRVRDIDPDMLEEIIKKKHDIMFQS